MGRQFFYFFVQISALCARVCVCVDSENQAFVYCIGEVAKMFLKPAVMSYALLCTNLEILKCILCWSGVSNLHYTLYFI